MEISFTSKAFLSGKQHPFINSLIFIDTNYSLSQHFRHLLRDEIKKLEKYFFDGSENQIKEFIGTGNLSIHTMLDRPLRVFPYQLKDVNIAIINFYEKPNESTKYCSVDLAEDNKQVMSFLSTNYSIENIRSFIDSYKNRDCGRQIILKN